MLRHELKFSTNDRPEIVCLCGSTRFKQEYEEANYQQTMRGRIVLSVGCLAHADNIQLTEEEKIMLDDLHKRKIDISDTIVVICPGGYIGQSTASEIDYAANLNKKTVYTFDGKTCFESLKAAAQNQHNKYLREMHDNESRRRDICEALDDN